MELGKKADELIMVDRERALSRKQLVNMYAHRAIKDKGKPWYYRLRDIKIEVEVSEECESVGLMSEDVGLLVVTECDTIRARGARGQRGVWERQCSDKTPRTRRRQKKAIKTRIGAQGMKFAAEHQGEPNAPDEDEYTIIKNHEVVPVDMSLYPDHNPAEEFKKDKARWDAESKASREVSERREKEMKEVSKAREQARKEELLVEAQKAKDRAESEGQEGTQVDDDGDVVVISPMPEPTDDDFGFDAFD